MTLYESLLEAVTTEYDTLRVLKQSRLVKFRKEGKTVYYSLADSHVRSIIDQGYEHIKE